MRNCEFDTRDVKKCCENKLDIRFRPGGELNGWYLLDGKKIARVTVAKGRKPIPPKTYKNMAEQLKLSVEQFDRLLACPLTAKDYQKLMSDMQSPKPAPAH